jgi:hypothetical protein
MPSDRVPPLQNRRSGRAPRVGTFTLCTLLLGWFALAGSSTATAAPGCPRIKTIGGFCFRGETGVLTRFDVCGNTALLCTTTNGTDDCATVDLATGSYQRALPAASVPRAHIEQQNKVVSVCVGARCVATDLPPSESPFQVDVSDDGKRAVVTVDDPGANIDTIDTTTGKRLRTVKLPMRPSDQLGPAYFLGDTLFVLVGQWPIERAILVAPDGTTRPLADNFGRGKPFALGGQRFAIPSYGGGVVSVLDLKTGKVTSSPPPPDDAHACIDCFNDGNDPTLGARRLGLAASGKLVLISVLGVSTVDPRTLKTVRFPLPQCPSPRP